MFTTEFLTDVVGIAGRQTTGGNTRSRALLQFLAVAEAVRERLRATLAELGCTELGFEVLTTLHASKSESLPPSFIADHTGIFRGTLTDVLARLEAGGLIARRRNEADRRELHATLTPRGREQCERIVERYVSAMLEITADLAPATLAVFSDALVELNRKTVAGSSSITADHER